MTEKLQHVLVTRPAGRGRTMHQALAESGLRSIDLPLLNIVALDDAASVLAARRALTAEDCGEATGALDGNIDVALFVSANAVEAAAIFCQRQEISWRADLPCIGMGTATNRAICEQGWQCLAVNKESGHDSLTSEQLLQTAWARGVEGQQILIFKGEKGRATLASHLAELGALVREVTLYRREPVGYSEAELLQKLQPLRDNPAASAAIFASGDSIAAFGQLINGGAFSSLIAELLCLVPSLRVAAIARGLGFEKVLVAGGASDSAFLPHLLALAH